MNIVLIDKRISRYEDIVAAIDPALAVGVVFDYFEDTFDTLKARMRALGLNGTSNSVGLIQHNYRAPMFSMLASADIAPVAQVESQDPGLERWSQFRDFIGWCKTEMNTAHFDMMACALYSDTNWKYVIDTLTTQTGVTVRASTDNTGAATMGGNWFLESHTGVNLKTVYFTAAIEEYRGILYLHSYDIRENSTKGFATGGVQAWGNSTYGGIDPEITGGVVAVYSTFYAFAALKTDGSVQAWGNSTYGGLLSPGITGDVVSIYSTDGAFAALKTDGSVQVWGYSTYGGLLSPGITGGVVAVYSNAYAFAALKTDGSVVAWGDSYNGGLLSPGITGGVVSIYSTDGAFAALKTDGSVQAWGDSTYGGDSSDVSESLTSGVVAVYSNYRAFAALKSDGSVVAWGNSTYGGATPANVNSGVVSIYSTFGAFAALKSDGSVVAWGNSTNGGTDPGITGGVVSIYSTDSAFAALKADGSVVTWGNSANGGSLSPGITGGVVSIYSTYAAFAALKTDGSVVAWGNSDYGGILSIASAGSPYWWEYTYTSVASNLTSGVVAVYSNAYAFAALKTDGSVVAWGDSYNGGLLSPGITGGVVSIYSTDGAFAALKTDGSVQAWGDSTYGGLLSPGITGGVVSIYSTYTAFAALKSDATTFDLSAAYYRDIDRYDILRKKENRCRVDLTALNNNVFTLSNARDIQSFNPAIPSGNTLRIIVPDYVASSYSIAWTSRTSAADNAWFSVAYGNGLWVAVANSGTGNRVMTSPDGITWTIRTSPADNEWISVAYGNGLWVAVAYYSTTAGNRVMTSPDGITWTIRTSAADNNWFSVAYGNGLWVAVADTGDGNRVMTSPDGINWTIRTSAADNSWRSVSYGNGLWVAVSISGTGNRVMTSPDGITWTSRTSAADNQWISVAYGNGLWVAVSISGIGNRVMTSPDGINWTIRTSAADNFWNSVAYGNGLWVAVADTGDGNRVMTSPDGTTWTLETSAVNNSWSSVAYDNGLWVAVSYDGTGNRVMTYSGENIVLTSHSITSTATIPNSAGSFIVACDEGEPITISGTTYVNYGSFVYKRETDNTYTKLTSATINDTLYTLYGGDGVNSSGIGLVLAAPTPPSHWASGIDGPYALVAYGSYMYVGRRGQGVGIDRYNLSDGSLDTEYWIDGVENTFTAVRSMAIDSSDPANPYLYAAVNAMASPALVDPTNIFKISLVDASIISNDWSPSLAPVGNIAIYGAFMYAVDRSNEVSVIRKLSLVDGSVVNANFATINASGDYFHGITMNIDDAGTYMYVVHAIGKISKIAMSDGSIVDVDWINIPLEAPFTYGLDTFVIYGPSIYAMNYSNGNIVQINLASRTITDAAWASQTEWDVNNSYTYIAMTVFGSSLYVARNDTGVIDKITLPAVSNICFPASAPVQTDQGIVEIARINTAIHTIDGMCIVDITKTVTNDSFLVRIGRHALGKDYPTQDTVISRLHKLEYGGRMVAAEWLVGQVAGVARIPYSGEPLYNVILAEPRTMRVNNLICETLLPSNPTAKLYARSSRYTEYTRDIILSLLKTHRASNNREAYRKVLSSL